MLEYKQKKDRVNESMNAKAIVHINGHKYDVNSGEKLGDANNKSSPAPKKQRARASAVTPKTSHNSRNPARSVTLARFAVKKPKILHDIRHIPIAVPSKKVIRNHPSSVGTSPKIVHFAKIEPRVIDTSPASMPHVALPDTPPPIISHRNSPKAEHHIRRQLSAATAHQNAHHHKPKTKHRTKKAPMLASGVAVAVLISGFIVYQSMPNLSVNLASERAGISARIPAYTPSGFSLSKDVVYSPGRVVVSFKSNTDDRQYKIEQQTPNLNKAELEKVIQESSKGQYQIIDMNGFSVYISDSTARWSKDGMLFTLTGESGLSSTQIASIATSL